MPPKTDAIGMAVTAVPRKRLPVFFLIVFIQLLSVGVHAQMRQVYRDVQEENPIRKINFYSANEGYVAFRQWIGFTQDSGKTFTRKYITIGNVDYNGYGVNLTFGFDICGVKAFNRDTILVYGDYGFVPSILYSTDQGNTFKLIHHTNYNADLLVPGLTDMVFPGNTAIGYAVEPDRIIKTFNRGKTWLAILNTVNGYYDYIDAPDENTIIAFSAFYGNKPYITTNAGTLWTVLQLPAGQLHYINFINANKGWASVGTDLYYTSNSGTTWTKKNIDEFYCTKMKFINDSTGYAIAGPTVYKTTDSGKIWEPLHGNNNNSDNHHDLFLLNANQFWAGGDHGFLEITTNAGGEPKPKALFKIDTSGVSATNTVKLVNYSKTTYQYKWFKNDTLISTSYNSTYTHNIYRGLDTIMLVVQKGTYTDTMTLYQYFNIPEPPAPAPVITSFTPTTGRYGGHVTITGDNFINVKSVTFGGIQAISFVVNSVTQITALVSQGATGSVVVTTASGTAQLAGFTFIPQPIINSFFPTEGKIGDTISITGKYFTGATYISFGDKPAASFTVVSDNMIKAVLANGATGEINVATPGGNDVLGGFVFHYPPKIAVPVPNTGGAGDTITINGQYFTNVLSVTFGGVPAASFIVDSETTIKAILGKGADGIVAVTTPYGVATSGNFNFMYPPEIDSFAPLRGGKGTIIHLIGDDFRYTTSVTIGGVPAAQLINESTGDILVKVGDGASGKIVLTTIYGTATSTDSFTWYPVPTIQSFTPASAVAGSIITITGTNFIGTTDVRIGGASVTSFTVNSNTSITAIVPLAATGDITVLTYGGTASLNGFTFISKSAPVINSFSPVSGIVGTTVTIKGKNFNTTAPGNMVYFGATKATVLQATDSTLSVTVPAGATYEPISVTAYHVTGFSNAPFTVTFPGEPLFTANSFKKSFESGCTDFLSAGSLHHNDLDGDGKPDIVAIGADGVTIFKNKSTLGNLVFEKQSMGAGVIGEGRAVIGDVDGDGRPDLVIPEPTSGVLYGFARRVAVFRNISTPGNILFDTLIRFNAADAISVNNIILGNDLTDDGKPDIVLVYRGNSPSIAIYKNISSGARLSFERMQTLTSQGGMRDVMVNDMDGDGKPDIVVGRSGSYSPFRNSILVYRNKSTSGVASFDPAVSFPAGISTMNNIIVGDMDGDGKPDIATMHTTGSFIVRNTSQPGTLSFAAAVNFPFNNTGNIAMPRIHMNDFNGDDKPDIVFTKGGLTDSIAVFSNTSVTGTISFAPPINYFVGDSAMLITSGDLDGDGKPEITVASDKTPAFLVIFGNNITGNSTMLQLCSGTDTTLDADKTGTSYQWQLDTGNGFANITDKDHFNGSTTLSLELKNIPTAWNNYIFRCKVDADYSRSYYLKVDSSVIPGVIIDADTSTICSGTQVIFTATPVNEGSAPAYQWQVNGINAGTNNDSLVLSSLSNNDQVKVLLTSNASCLVKDTAASNSITMTVNPPVTPALTISGTTTVKEGDSVALLTTTFFGGAPAYQWQDSTSTHTWQNIIGATEGTLVYTPTLTGNKVRCILTSTYPCATILQVTSAPLAFTVNKVTSINPVPADSYGIVFYPNPVNSALVIDSLRLSDQWQTIEITGFDGKQRLRSNSIINQRRIELQLGKLPNGMYVAVLRKKSGEAVYYKFIKL